MCIKVQNPVVVKPKFKEYCIYGSDLARKYLDLGVRMPFPRSDNWYYHTDREGWAKLVEHLVIKSSFYKKDKRDCDWYARKAYVMCCELFELNTMLYTYGTMPLGAHGFCTFFDGDTFLIFEPNEGFNENLVYHDLWGYLGGDIVFEWGENGYEPMDVLI